MPKSKIPGSTRLLAQSVHQGSSPQREKIGHINAAFLWRKTHSRQQANTIAFAGVIFTTADKTTERKEILQTIFMRRCGRDKDINGTFQETKTTAALL